MSVYMCVCGGGEVGVHGFCVRVCVCVCVGTDVGVWVCTCVHACVYVCVFVCFPGYEELDLQYIHFVLLVM